MSGLEGNRLVQRLAELRAAGRGGVAPYVTAGDGGLERTLQVLHGLEEGGAVCVELGVPFSDPVADGPRLQAAAQRALAGGTTVDGVLDVVQRYRAAGGALPIALFSYMNPLLAGGLEARMAALRAAGVDGLLVPDLPLDEAEPVRAAARGAGLALSLFVAPTSGDARTRIAAAETDGFLYVVGRVGVTGASTAFDRGNPRIVRAGSGRPTARCRRRDCPLVAARWRPAWREPDPRRREPGADRTRPA